MTFLLSRADAPYPPGGVALISMFETFRVESCPPKDRRHTHGYRMPIGWCGYFDVDRWRSHPQQPKNGSYELAVVALSTHSGD